MDQLISSWFQQSYSTGTAPDEQRGLLEQNLTRLFAPEGTVELWESRAEPEVLMEQTFSSPEEFRTVHMVSAAYPRLQKHAAGRYGMFELLI
jgi:hypothetical protein